MLKSCNKNCCQVDHPWTYIAIYLVLTIFAAWSGCEQEKSRRQYATRPGEGGGHRRAGSAQR